MEKDKQKYGIEASQANAKYYQCLEQVKLKNNLITKLQKKNIEAEGRLKQQQNLYEAVRSDRNLYSKNLIEAQEEIAELRGNYYTEGRPSPFRDRSVDDLFSKK